MAGAVGLSARDRGVFAGAPGIAKHCCRRTRGCGWIADSCVGRRAPTQTGHAYRERALRAYAKSAVFWQRDSDAGCCVGDELVDCGGAVMRAFRTVLFGGDAARRGRTEISPRRKV